MILISNFLLNLDINDEVKKTGLRQNILEYHALIKEMSQQPDDYIRKFDLEKNSYQMSTVPETPHHSQPTQKSLSNFTSNSRSILRSPKLALKNTILSLANLGTNQKSKPLESRTLGSLYGSRNSQGNRASLKSHESNYRSHSVIKRDKEYDQFCTNIENRTVDSSEFKGRESAHLVVSRYLLASYNIFIFIIILFIKGRAMLLYTETFRRLVDTKIYIYCFGFQNWLKCFTNVAQMYMPVCWFCFGSVYWKP